MWSKPTIVAGTIALIAVIALGCADKDYKTPTRLHHEATGARAAEVNAFFTPMIDNAAAYDMSLADFHFVPHTVHLNSLGKERLTQLTTVLQSYGGIVRYETYRTDEDVLDGRLDAVRSYLLACGCDPERVEVKSMLSGGRGRTAKEAIEATKQDSKQKKTTELGPGALLAGDSE